MSYLEEEYLRKVSYRLRNFKPQGKHKYNFSCPICGDSQKNKKKARGYAFDKAGKLYIYCHNCYYSEGFPVFLKELDQLLYQEFIVEKFKNKGVRGTQLGGFIIDDDEGEEVEPVETKTYIPNIFEGLPLVADLDGSHYVKQWAADRHLPLDEYELFFAENFIEWTKGNTDKFANWRDHDHPRVVIPFKGRDGHYIGYSARALHGEEPKYYRIFIDENEKEKFFGIDRLDESKQVYVLEGEIDSMFLPNAVAVSNGKLDTYYNKDAIYIPDTNTRNPHIMRNTKELIQRGLKVSLIPADLPGKDINELVKAGFDRERILAIINENVVQGLSGMLKFNQWNNSDLSGTYDKRTRKIMR